MKVLVTGAAGFIGSHTVDLLLAEGHTVRALDNLDPQVHTGSTDKPRFLSSHLGSARFQFVKGDVRNPGLLGETIDGVDAIIHLAAAVGVAQSMYRPDYFIDVNGRGTAVLLEYLANHDHNVRKVVVASSNTLYGEGAYEEVDGKRVPIPTPESHRLHPASIYAVSKRLQEEMVLLFGRTYGIPSVALRYFNVFGPRQSLSNPYTGVAAIFISRLLAGKRPVIFEDGEQTRDFVHVRDVARANVLAATRDGADGQAINVGTGEPLSVLRLAAAIGAALDKEHLKPTMDGRSRPGDVRHCYADTTKARERLEFEATLRLETSLDELIAWARSEDFQDRSEQAMAELETRGLVK